jgi:hypothetical protein
VTAALAISPASDDQERKGDALVPIVRYEDWKRWYDGLSFKPQGGSFPWRFLTAEGEAVLKVLTEFLGKPTYHGTSGKGTFFKWRLPADADEAPFHVACDALEERGLPRPAIEVTPVKPNKKYVRLRFPLYGVGEIQGTQGAGC